MVSVDLYDSEVTSFDGKDAADQSAGKSYCHYVAFAATRAPSRPTEGHQLDADATMRCDYYRLLGRSDQNAGTVLPPPATKKIPPTKKLNNVQPGQKSATPMRIPTTR